MTQGLQHFQAATDVSRETLEKLQIYAELLKKWTKRINLVSPSSIPNLWSRHFLDSAQMLSITQVEGDYWADLGSGGGFPGAVIAIMRSDAPKARTTLVESDQRKATFLRTVARETGIEMEVICERIENVSPLNCDVLTARALAPLNTLLEYTQRHRATGGAAMFLKGEKAMAEVAEARKSWSFECERFGSKTDPNANILLIGAIESV